MNRPTCPFLGLRDDPTTALSFPSEGNFCHHARPVSPVNRAYQQQFCLTPDHRACPLYLAARPAPMPPALVEPAAARAPSRQMALLMALPLLLVGLILAVLVVNALRPRGIMPDVIPDTGPLEENNWFSGEPGDTSTPFSPLLQDPAPVEEQGDCPMPGGWMPYTVNPTDSLYRLSVIYGVPVETFQRVNCLGDSTAILPGQVIYVPYIPTNTPVPGLEPSPGVQNTFRPPVIQPVRPQVQPTRSSGGGRQPASTSTPEPTITLRPSSTVSSTVPASTVTVPPTQTPTLRPTSTTRPSNTPTPRPTSTVQPSNTPTLQPTSTTRPSNTPTLQPTNTPRPRRTRTTNTPVPTNTLPPTSTFAPTFTPLPTNTPLPPPTSTPEPLPTDPPFPTEPPVDPTVSPLSINKDPITQILTGLLDTVQESFDMLLPQ